MKSNNNQVGLFGRKKTGFASTATILSKYLIEDKGGYVTKEFQDYGYRLAMNLNDVAHKSLYIKMAKEIDRAILEKALSFVTDSNATSKARLFMWKVKQLQSDRKSRSTQPTETPLPF